MRKSFTERWKISPFHDYKVRKISRGSLAQVVVLEPSNSRMNFPSVQGGIHSVFQNNDLRQAPTHPTKQAKTTQQKKFYLAAIACM